jgi:hypothetical protein
MREPMDIKSAKAHDDMFTVENANGDVFEFIIVPARERFLTQAALPKWKGQKEPNDWQLCILSAHAAALQLARSTGQGV